MQGGLPLRRGPAAAVTARPSLGLRGAGAGYPRGALPGFEPLLPAGWAGRGRSRLRWQGRDVSATWPRGGAGGTDTRTGLGEWVPGGTGGAGFGVYRRDAPGGQRQPVSRALRSPHSPSHPPTRASSGAAPGAPAPLPVPGSRGPPRRSPAGPAPTAALSSRRSPGSAMRNPRVMLMVLLLLGPAARAAPRAGTNRLLWSAVRSLGPPEQDVEAMTREQALLYLFVLHDHDQSRRLDGLELLQLLGTVLAQAGGQPDPDMVAALVDQALARQDLNRDGLLDPSELLDPPEMLLPGQDQGPPGQPPLEQQAGVGAVPGEGTEMPRQDLGLRSPGQAATEAGDPQTAAPEDGAPKVESLEVESPNAEALEAEVVPGAKAPSTDATEEEEAPEAEASEEEAAPAWRDHGEG
ncbi:cell growth regulator with EF hand domain protein 1 isoform X2 [Prinia subflava]|uniref:cell growth regulator with EF hand domain protein 1 isoform X2 n=1 Tax=Prinia subflava TaxID=208062 RepID=UPI002FE17D84